MYRAWAPSKTFLLGEYNVLTGGSAIIINTEPYFELHTTNQLPTGWQAPLHPQSQTYQFIHRYPDMLATYRMSFIDPHQAKGGFGRSSAEFLMAYAFRQFACNQNTWSIEDALRSYRACTKTCNTYQPSGADLIAQYHGQVTIISTSGHQALAWPFAEQSKLCLLRTHYKEPTHQHLTELHSIPKTALQPIVARGISALQHHDLKQLIQAVNDYQHILTTLQLTHQATLELIHALRQQTDSWAIKGCGALGADVLLIILDHATWPTLQTFAKQHRLEIVATEQNIGYGWQQTKETI